MRALALAGVFATTTAFAVPAAAAPVAAAPVTTAINLSAFDASRFDPASTTADWRCRGWGCRGWGRGGGWGRRGWRRNRVDAGDVLLGAAIIGGIAAIASSNNRRARDRDVVVVDRDRDWRDDDRRFDDRRFDDRRTTPRRGTGAGGLDSAVDQCLTRIERDVRVDTVDNVERNGSGWAVSGTLFNGSPFACRIGNDGRIADIDYAGSGNWGGASLDPAAPRADGQWSDDRYAAARLAAGGIGQPSATPVPQEVARIPAYPGGPIPGEDIPETIDGDIGG
jgi:hypothetical protein